MGRPGVRRTRPRSEVLSIRGRGASTRYQYHLQLISISVVVVQRQCLHRNVKNRVRARCPP
jgi:hypothetical protein